MIQDKINEDLKTAMKAHDTIAVSTLRLLNSEIKNAEIENRGPLVDEQVTKVIQRELKKRKDAIEAYEKANAADKAETEKQELKILQGYLPEQLPKEELEKIVDQAMSETGASTISDMGKVVGIVMGKAGASADGKTVADLVRSKLQ